MTHLKPGANLIHRATALAGLAVAALGAPMLSASAAPVALYGAQLDAVTAAGAPEGFVLDAASTALLSAFLASLGVSVPVTISASQAATQPTITPDPPPIPTAPPQTESPPAPSVSVSATATATACCGPNATASSFVFSTIGAQSTTLRDFGARGSNGEVTATSTFSFPLPYRTRFFGQ